MSRFLLAAAAALLAASTFSAPASATEQTAVAGVTHSAAISTDLSARRYYRHYRRYGYRGYGYRPYYSGGYYPYAYAPRPYYYRRPAFPFWPFF